MTETPDGEGARQTARRAPAAFAGRRGRRSLSLGAAIVGLAAAAAGAGAFTGLPADGTQLNNDTSAGIAPADAAGNADVVGGALVAGKPAVPWAIFEQATTGGTQQVFSRAFSAGAWATKGHGTVNGLGQTTFPSSLNFDETQDAEAPSIDFAGAGRTVPWATWYEQSTALGSKTQIFASRFDSTADKWVFAGQGRGIGPTTPPSLNIDPSKDAEDPAVAGGSTDASAAPGPWITWEEQDNSLNQIFVSKPVKLATGVATCPAGTKPTGGVAVGGFCWQQVGVERLLSEPSLNVDVTRDGVEPDVAFTGPSDTVPWVVWYEEDGPGQFGVTNERVFAAKGVSGNNGIDGGDTVDGGFHWQAVGNGTAGKTEVLQSSTTSGCVTSKAEEDGCTLNKDASADAEDPRVAAGTMAPGGVTVPWVVWDEQSGGTSQIFVSRLVGGDHFALANSGAPLSTGSDPSVRPDISFSGNTPYVSWRQQVGSAYKAFYGHFVNAANPTFVLDNPGGTAVSADGLSADVRTPISSGCTANPLNADGAACQGGAVGSPFFVLNDGASGAGKLFGDGFISGTPTTGAATGMTVTGAVDQQGGPAEVHFDYGTSTAYDQSTSPQLLGPATGATPFSAVLTGVPAGTTIHYRASVRTDFGTLTGADQTLTSAPPPAGSPPVVLIPGPPVTVADHTAPTLTTKKPKLSLASLKRAGKLKVSVKLSEAGSVTVTLLVSSQSIGSVKVKYTKAAAKSIVVKLSKLGKLRIAHRKHLTLTVRIAATDKAGNKAKSVSTKLKL